MAITASATRTTTDLDASIGTNAQRIRIAERRASASTPRVQRYRVASATAIWDGSGPAVARVSTHDHLAMQSVLTIRVSLESALKSSDIDFTLYRSKQLSPNYRIHWRILKELKEIELVMVVNGTSWAGLGWRPRQLNATCRNFPAIHEFGHVEAQPEPTAEPEPEPQASAEPAAEPAAEPTAEPTSEPEPKSLKTKRDDAHADITVATSVSYRVSTKTGRRRRAAATTESTLRLLRSSKSLYYQLSGICRWIFSYHCHTNMHSCAQSPNVQY